MIADYQSQWRVRHIKLFAVGIVSAVALLVGFPALAQEGGNFLGSGGFVPRKSSPQWRVVNGNIYDANNSPLWGYISGQIVDISGNEILISLQSNGQWVIVKNFSGEKAMDKFVIQSAIKTGTEEWSGSMKTGNGVYEVWDCGTVYVPSPAEIEAQKKVAEAAAKARAEHQWQVDSNAVKWLYSQATNGSAFAQCDLGLHYLNGRGCETNRDLAIYWLKQAATNGDMEASNKLASLKAN